MRQAPDRGCWRVRVALACAALALAVAALVPTARAFAADPAHIVLSGREAASYPALDTGSLPQLSANSFACVDSDGNVYAHYRGYDRVKIASTTKVMTAIIAAEYPGDKKVRVSALAQSITGSGAGVMEGDVVDLYELMEGLMLPSGNDAAYAIAESIGEELLASEGKPLDVDSQAKVARFVDEMNLRAAQLGMADTLFANPCGLDDEGFEGPHCSCAVDVAKMTAAAMSVPVIAEISSEYEASMIVQRGDETISIPLVNTNRLLAAGIGVTGTKTGFTDQAGGCFAGTRIIGGDAYYAAVLGCASTGRALDEACELWNWTENSRLRETVFDGSRMPVATLAAPQWAQKTYEGVAASPFSFGLWTWEEPYSVSVELAPAEDEPVSEGEEVGRVVARNSEGAEVSSVPVLADRNIDGPNMVERMGVSVERLYASENSGEGVARNEVRDVMPSVLHAYIPEAPAPLPESPEPPAQPETAPDGGAAPVAP